jgi:hypothetical protein
MKIYNVKENMPTKLEAGKLLAEFIKQHKNEKVIKIIHGYGSTGVGGSIKQIVHKSLRNKRKSKEIKAFIPSEAIFELQGFDEDISKYLHLIKNDIDAKRPNDGVTFVIL